MSNMHYYLNLVQLIDFRLQVLRNRRTFRESKNSIESSHQSDYGLRIIRNSPTTNKNYYRNLNTDNPSSPYSHNDPVLISAPVRKIYKSLANPAAFYKNKNLFNTTWKSHKPTLSVNPNGYKSVTRNNRMYRPNDSLKLNSPQRRYPKSESMSVDFKGTTLKIHPKSVTKEITYTYGGSPDSISGKMILILFFKIIFNTHNNIFTHYSFQALNQDLKQIII